MNKLFIYVISQLFIINSLLKKFIPMRFLLTLINDELAENILQISDKLATKRLPCAIWPMFSSFLVFCCYFTLGLFRKSVAHKMTFSDPLPHVTLCCFFSFSHPLLPPCIILEKVINYSTKRKKKYIYIFRIYGWVGNFLHIHNAS